MIISAYDSTVVPANLNADCAIDYCLQKGLGGTILCLEAWGDVATATCSDFSGCFIGSPLGEICETNIP